MPPYESEPVKFSFDRNTAESFSPTITADDETELRKTSPDIRLLLEGTYPRYPTCQCIDNRRIELSEFAGWARQALHIEKLMAPELERADWWKAIRGQKHATKWQLRAENRRRWGDAQRMNDVVLLHDNHMGTGNTAMMLVAEFGYSDVAFMFSCLFPLAERVPDWEPGTQYYDRLLEFSPNFDLVYSRSRDQLGGLVKARDSLFIRKCAFLPDDEGFVCVAGSVESRHVPLNEGMVRATVHPGAMRVTRVGEGLCRVEWLLNIGINIKLPSFVLNKFLTQNMLDWATNIRGFMAEQWLLRLHSESDSS